jgi:uncharacterized repeat protein (TIGR01451 family)
VGRRARHADARRLQAVLLLGVCLLGWTGPADAQRGSASPEPIAATPTPGAPVAPDRNVPAAKQPVIASTPPPGVTPPASGSPTIVQPVAAWPSLKPAPQETGTTGQLPLIAPAPSARAVVLSVEKSGPASSGAGMPFDYEILVRNAGALPAFQVRVLDSLPAGARCTGGIPRPEVQGERLLWDLGTMEPRSERRLRVEITLTGEPDLSLPVSVTFATGNAPPPPVTPPPPTAARPETTQARLELVVAGPESVAAGQPVPLQMKVSNTGNAPAAHVVVHNTLPAGLQHPEGADIEADLGTLAPGETRTLTLDTTAIQQGRLVNRARVTAEGIEPAAAETIVTVTAPALTVKLSGPSESAAGQEVEYLLKAANAGAAPVADAQLLVHVPEGLEFVAAGEGHVHDEAGRVVRWLLGTLPAGKARTLPIKLRAQAVGERLIRVELQGGQEARARSELMLRVEGMSTLLLEVADPGDPVKVGSEALYEIRVLNQGSASAAGVKVTAVVPDGLTILGADGPSSHRREGQRVLFEPVQALAASADLLYRVRVRGKSPGDWRFRAELQSGQSAQLTQQEESTRVTRE